MTLPMTDGSAQRFVICAIQVRVGDRLQVWVSELRNTSLILASDPKKARHGKTFADSSFISIYSCHIYSYLSHFILIWIRPTRRQLRWLQILYDCLDMFRLLAGVPLFLGGCLHARQSTRHPHRN